LTNGLDEPKDRGYYVKEEGYYVKEEMYRTTLKRKDAPTTLKRECPDVQMSTLLKEEQKKESQLL